MFVCFTFLTVMHKQVGDDDNDDASVAAAATPNQTGGDETILYAYRARRDSVGFALHASKLSLARDENREERRDRARRILEPCIGTRFFDLRAQIH